MSTTTKRQRPRRDWAALVEAHSNSSESVHEFCKSRGISETYFYKQRRELLGGSREHTKAIVEDFVSLPLTATILDVELSLGEGVVLRIRRG